MQNSQAAVLSGYGTGGVPAPEGPTMGGMSSGWMRDSDDTATSGRTRARTLLEQRQPARRRTSGPRRQLAASAGCSGNCPAGSGAYDSMMLRLQIRVPTNALSFSLQLPVLHGGVLALVVHRLQRLLPRPAADRSLGDSRRPQHLVRQRRQPGERQQRVLRESVRSSRATAVPPARPAPSSLEPDCSSPTAPAARSAVPAPTATVRPAAGPSGCRPPRPSSPARRWSSSSWSST